MTREEAIDIITGLYPADSEYSITKKVGQQLLEQAKKDTEDWRDSSDKILFRYAELCEQRETEEMRKFNKQFK